MDDAFPENVLDYQRVKTRSGDAKYVSPNRESVIIIVGVSTSGGDVFQCTLYDATSPYGYGDRITSTMAETESGVADAISELDQHR